jgi:dTDP-4-amino-4,6-dideoxygalactose transaminase
MIGGNFRLDAIQAAVLLVKLKYLDDWSQSRQQNAERYDQLFESLGSLVQTPTVVPGARHIYNQYTLRVSDRDGLRAHLAEKDIGTEIYYPVPLHMQECFSNLGYAPSDCPQSEAAASSVLAVPIYPELTATQQKYVFDSCAEFLQKVR